MAEQMKIKITADGSQARRELNQTKKIVPRIFVIQHSYMI